MNNQAVLVTLMACAVPSLTACIPAPDAESMPSGAADSNGGSCNSKAVESYIGKRFTAVLAEQMRKEAGATLLRTGAKGGAVTMDYRPERLNIFYDEAMLIAIVNCG